MATKKTDIAALVDKSMVGRNLADDFANADRDGTPVQTADLSQRERFRPAPKQQVMLRLDDGDYRTLQQIAERKGTKAATLIRQAVKDIIRQESGA
jgi:16S rRNA U516 pseudouridylate synthase RsuA-like enzyme